MGNVVSVLVSEWPGLLPQSYGVSATAGWIMQWAWFVAKLALKTTTWLFGLTTVQLPSLTAVFQGVRGKNPARAAVSIVSRLLSWCLALFRHFVSPDLVMRQLLAVVLLQSAYETYRFVKSRRRARQLGDHRQLLVDEMKSATSFVQWKLAAAQLDAVEGLDAWRFDNNSPYYDASQVELKLRHIQFLVRKGDVMALRWHLRGELLRKHLGVTNPELFGRSYVGTKRLVEEYTQAVAAALDYLCDVNAEADTPDSIVEKLAFFNETRHAFGRSAFLFSGGASLGLYHLGVVKALVEKKLLPRVISGASAGSIVAGVLGCHTDEEMLSMLENGTLNTQFFGVRARREDSGSSDDDARSGSGSLDGGVSGLGANATWFHKLVLLLPEPFKSLAAELRRIVPRWVKERTLLDIEVLAECLRENLGDMTFAEAYEHTGRIVNITVTPNNSTDFPSLLNYLTAPHVLVWSAALASCAIPGVFAPVELIAKDRNGVLRPYLPGGLRWSDGSVECDLPMARLSELFNVNVFIVSQVNPHASLFANTGLGGGPVPKLIQFLKRSIKSFIQNVSDLGLATALRPLWRGLLPLVTQKYEGDCTIVPGWTFDDVRKLMANPTPERLQAAILTGMQSTWPKISWIRTHCLIEFTLDECISRLRDRMQRLAALEEAKRMQRTRRASRGRLSGGAGAAAAPRAGSAYWGRQASLSMVRTPSFTTSRSIVALADMAAGLSSTRTLSSENLVQAKAHSSPGNAQRHGGLPPTQPVAASASSDAASGLRRSSSWRAPLHEGEWVSGAASTASSRSGGALAANLAAAGGDTDSDGDAAGEGDDRQTPLVGAGLAGTRMKLGSMARLNILDEQMVERAYATMARNAAAHGSPPTALARVLQDARRRSASSPPLPAMHRAAGVYTDAALPFPSTTPDNPSYMRPSSSVGSGLMDARGHVGWPSDGESAGSPPAWWHATPPAATVMYAHPPSHIPNANAPPATSLLPEAAQRPSVPPTALPARHHQQPPAPSTADAAGGSPPPHATHARHHAGHQTNPIDDVQLLPRAAAVPLSGRNSIYKAQAVGAGAITRSHVYAPSLPQALPTMIVRQDEPVTSISAPHSPPAALPALLPPGRSLTEDTDNA